MINSNSITRLPQPLNALSRRSRSHGRRQITRLAMLPPSDEAKGHGHRDQRLDSPIGHGGAETYGNTGTTARNLPTSNATQKAGAEPPAT